MEDTDQEAKDGKSLRDHEIASALADLYEYGSRHGACAQDVRDLLTEAGATPEQCTEVVFSICEMEEIGSAAIGSDLRLSEDQEDEWKVEARKVDVVLKALGVKVAILDEDHTREDDFHSTDINFPTEIWRERLDERDGEGDEEEEDERLK